MIFYVHAYLLIDSSPYSINIIRIHLAKHIFLFDFNIMFSRRSYCWKSLQALNNKKERKKNTYTHARLCIIAGLLTVTYSSGKPYLTVSFLIKTDSRYWMDECWTEYIFYFLFLQYLLRFGILYIYAYRAGGGC